MSWRNGLCWGKKWGPWIGISLGGASAGINEIEDVWDEYFEPYYRNWTHPDDHIQYGVYLSAKYWSHFYVNDNVLPANPRDPNDPNYNWAYIEDLRLARPIAQGVAKLKFRLDSESSAVPGFLVNSGDAFDGTGGRPVPAWHRQSAVNKMKDFIYAMARRFDGYTWMNEIGFEEDNSGPSPPADFTNQAWVAGRAEYVRYADQQFTNHMIFVAQSSGVQPLLHDTSVGIWVDDQRSGLGNCGSTHTPFPVTDCDPGSVWGLAQQYNGCMANPPSGIPRPVVCFTMCHGFRSTNDGNHSEHSPWGLPLPVAAERSEGTGCSPGSPAYVQRDINASQYCWYSSYEPRADAPRNNSNLGQAGPDNAGVIPTMAIGVQGTDSPGAWNLAFQRFGGNGTRAVPALPYDWLDDTGDPPPNPGDDILVIMGFSQTEQWLRPMLTNHPDVDCVAVTAGSATADQWANQAYMSSANEDVFSTSNADKEDGHRIALQIAIGVPELPDLNTYIEDCITNIRTLFPNMREIILIAVVGGPDDALCPSTGPNNYEGYVRDSYTHPLVMQEIETVAARHEDVIGIDINLDGCGGYPDGIGHLNTIAGLEIGEKMYDYLILGGSPPPPPDPPPDDAELITPASTAYRLGGGVATIDNHVKCTPLTGTTNTAGNVPFADDASNIDLEPPSVPGSLEMSALGTSSLRLTWAHSTDTQSGVSGYDIYLDDILYASTAGNEQTFVDLKSGTQYYAKLRAFDVVGNISIHSDTVGATTDVVGDYDPPILSATAVTSTQININWQPQNERDNIRFRIYRDDVIIRTTDRLVDSHFNLAPDTQYKFNVQEIDIDGNAGAKSTSFYVTTDERGQATAWSVLEDAN